MGLKGEKNKITTQTVPLPRNPRHETIYDLSEQFTILKKSRGKLDCLIYEMLFIKDKKPKQNTQSDFIKAELFTFTS